MQINLVIYPSGTLSVQMTFAMRKELDFLAGQRIQALPLGYLLKKYFDFI
ncbi:hypothetical protein NIES22_01250 [Calothrix brevissima NIES-22]|nr:hypothetical protein NIES22_01250 [Calothrix brevissima NIES-22]